MWSEVLDDMIKPEFREEIRKMADEPRNDLKHRRHPFDKKITFNPELLNKFFLNVCLDSITIKFPNLFSQHRDLGIAKLWFKIHYPHHFQGPPVSEALRKDVTLTKVDFYNKYLEISREHSQASSKNYQV
jgi:hypothetical protein